MSKKYAITVLISAAILGINSTHAATRDSSPLEYKILADENHDTWAQYKYGMMRRDGTSGIAQNISEAAMYFKKAADKGLAEAQYEYGLLLRDGLMLGDGKGIPRNIPKAIKYLKMAAAQGHMNAKDSLAAYK